MRIYTLWGQRKERYQGQYAPELIAAIDEWGMEENSSYLTDEESKASNSGEFDIIRRILININQKEFDEQLYGKVLKGDIHDETA